MYCGLWHAYASLRPVSASHCAFHLKSDNLRCATWSLWRFALFFGFPFDSYLSYASRFVLAGEVLEPCPEAEILFGTQRTCALYASEQSRFASKMAEFLDATLVVAEPDNGCDPSWINAEAVKGSIAVVNRGTCPFAVKATNAQAAGAIAVVVVNNQPGLINMVGNFSSVSIPAMLITQEDGTSLTEFATTGSSATLKIGPSAPHSLVSQY